MPAASIAATRPAKGFRLRCVPRRSAQHSSGLKRSAASNGSERVSVEIADAARLAGIRSHWTDLLGRAAAPNVFMDPALVGVAAAIEPHATHRALLAWKTMDGRDTLVGIWSFAVARPRRSILPMQTIVVPALRTAISRRR